MLVANFASDVGYAWWLMENFWREISLQVEQQNRRCILAYPVVREIPEQIKSAPIDIVEFRISTATPGDVLRSVAFLRKHRIRSIYLSDWPPTSWNYFLWRLAGVKRIVAHMHSGGEGPIPSSARAFVKDVVNALRLFSADLNVAPSPYMGQRLRAAGRVLPATCKVVTNGIRLFNCEPARRSTTREKIGVPHDAVLIVLVSRVSYLKGIDFAIRCAARLHSDKKLEGKFRFVHCGDGPDLPAFRELTVQLGIGDGFTFLGHRNDVRDILCAADIAFHPSRTEAMSLAILEFLCAGLAVLTSDLPSVSSAIVPGRTGMTYRFDDLDDAETALKRLIEDGGTRRSLGDAARKSCETLYNLDIMNETFRTEVIPAL